MSTNGHIPLSSFHILERTAASMPALTDLDAEVGQALLVLGLPAEELKGRKIAVSVGSRGIASLKETVRTVCTWLKAQGAQPFVFPGMGSHGGATAEGQRKVLENYGVTAEYIGAEIRSSMDAVCVGTSPEGLKAFMDRHAWESDGVLVFNRIKPHTDFTGSIESGLLKMMAVGMGKIPGAQQVHRTGWKFGFDTGIRAVSALVLASGKILAGLAVVENELHQICALQAALPGGIVALEEKMLQMARPLVPGLPFSKLDLLIVDELGKNISGTGMDTKVIGRGVEPLPAESPRIRAVYVRDLTAESAGNATGVALADIIHDRLYRKIDHQKTFINMRTSLNLPLAHVPMYLPSDRDALDFALGYLGSPEPKDQRIAWIRNTLDLTRVAISSSLVREAQALKGWRLAAERYEPEFDSAGDLARFL
jgi:hypothetical protein